MALLVVIVVGVKSGETRNGIGLNERKEQAMGKGMDLLTTLIGLAIMVALCVILVTFIGRAL